MLFFVKIILFIARVRNLEIDAKRGFFFIVESVILSSLCKFRVMGPAETFKVAYFKMKNANNNERFWKCHIINMIFSTEIFLFLMANFSNYSTIFHVWKTVFVRIKITQNGA